MNARKRKAPERRKVPAKQPGLLMQALAALGRALTRHPRRVAGLLSVCVASSFVAANALWYQPEGHPAPFFRTRDAADPTAIAGYRPLTRTHDGHAQDDGVTTIRIQRATDNDLRQIIGTETAPAAQPPAVAQSAGPSAATGANNTTQMSVAAAIQAAELQSAPPTHTLQEQPVGSIKGPIAIPVQRPSGSLKGEDPVAAAIRTAERGASASVPNQARNQALPKPPADIPAASKAAKPDAAANKATPVSASPRAPTATAPSLSQSTARQAASAQAIGDDAKLIMQIQRGLLNIAYTDVTVDGMAGAQTKAAIRHFQKHYRLPENGEPSELVLRKLKSIGAL